MLSFAERGALIVAVEENSSVMNVSRSDLLRLGIGNNDQIIVARSYAEAAGLMMAHKRGILLESLTSKVSKTPVRFLR